MGMAKGKPNSVRRLGRYWKNRVDWPDAHWLANEIQNESDRTAIILFATLLDDTLITRLSAIFGAKLHSDEFDHIFRYEGPLGRFSSRISLAQAGRLRVVCRSGTESSQTPRWREMDSKFQFRAK
jgi:hypothetical protein